MPNLLSETIAELNLDLTRPILGLLQGLTASELEQTAIEVILVHRRHVDEAETLFEKVEEAKTQAVDPTELAMLRRTYRVSMMRVHSFRFVVSAVVDALGYVPQVEPQVRS